MGNSSSTHEPLDKGRFQRGTFGDVTNKKAASFRLSKKSPKGMDRLRKSFRDSFRRRKERVPESAKPHQWQSDEQDVRAGTCAFPVKYLGCVEVFESRGMQVCEEALKVLRNSTARRRAVRCILHVSGDGLRVVDDDTKGLIVDQTIEKVSFCAPDRSHERGFSYICRDGTTRRWMCHGFLASKDSGERLSHAVGCAFAVCLERKQRRDKECGVTMTFDSSNKTFTRNGSFRGRSLTEQMEAAGIDAPTAVVIPQPKPFNPFAIERPHATPTMLERQGSFRGLGQLGSSSPFKRQMSLRINDLPSNAERQRQFLEPITPNQGRTVSPIPEVSPGQPDSVSQLCQELSQGLSLLSKNDDDDLNFNNQSSINQNTAAILGGSSPSEITSPQTNSTTISTTMSVFKTNTIISPHEMSVSSVTTTTNTATVTPYISNDYSPHKVVPIEASTALPNPEQWLGQVVKQSSPAPPPRRPPATLGFANRTKSLTNDPFDAEWASNAVKTETAHNTNPFISPPKPPAQSFQVQL